MWRTLGVLNFNTLLMVIMRFADISINTDVAVCIPSNKWIIHDNVR